MAFLSLHHCLVPCVPIHKVVLGTSEISVLGRTKIASSTIHISLPSLWLYQRPLFAIVLWVLGLTISCLPLCALHKDDLGKSGFLQLPFSEHILCSRYYAK